jgi:hypothetical protein
MPDLLGAIQHAALSRTLWLLPAPLLLGLAWHLAFAVRSTRGEATPFARTVGMAAVGLATGATLGHGVALGPNRAFVQPFAAGAHIGPVDASFGLCFDPLAAVGCSFACVVGLGVAGYLSTRPAGRSGPTWAWIELALAGALLSLLADGLPTLALGWTMAIAAAAWLAGWSDARAGQYAATRGASALGALVLGSSLLFWGLGGAWRGEDYLREVGPSFAPLRTAEGTGAGSVSLATLPGAAVYVDDAKQPAATAPFAALPVQPGRHEIRIHSGSGSDDAVVDIVMPPEGARFALVPSGPSLSFRDLGAWAASVDGASPLVSRLRDRPGPGGVGVASAVLALWSLAAWFVRPAAASAASPLPLALLASVATELIPGATLVARATVLVPAVPWMEAVLGAVLVAIAVSYGLALARAIRRSGPMAAPSSPVERALVRVGTLLVRFEYWVLDAVVGAAAASLAVAAWIVARVEDDVVEAPFDRMAAGVARLESRVAPIHGGSLARVGWWLLALGAVAVGIVSLLQEG